MNMTRVQEGKRDAQPRKKNEEEKQEDETDSDDEFLAAAAAVWASSKAVNEHESERHPPPDTSGPSRPETWSLHVTQLPFEATDYDIRTAFVQKGCGVSSVRLVYDRDGAHRTFRGVAFVDVADEESYQKALELDRTVLQGRKINVRPTRSKSELANIVERSKEIVADKIKRQKEIDDAKERDGENKKAKTRASNEKEPQEWNAKRQKKSGEKGRPDKKKSDGDQSTKGIKAPDTKERDFKNKKDKKRTNSQEEPKEPNTKRHKGSGGKGRPDKNKSDGDQSTRGHKTPEAAISKKHTAPEKARPSSGDQKLAKKEQKLTKKERNRRAAIIMARQRKK